MGNPFGAFLEKQLITKTTILRAGYCFRAEISAMVPNGRKANAINVIDLLHTLPERLQTIFVIIKVNLLVSEEHRYRIWTKRKNVLYGKRRESMFRNNPFEPAPEVLSFTVASKDSIKPLSLRHFFLKVCHRILLELL